MPTPARQFIEQCNTNPFPGIAALERATGQTIRSRLGGNEALAQYPANWRSTYSDAFLTRCRQYQDPSAWSLRQVLARQQGIQADELLVDAGADSLILLFLRSFSDFGDTVLCAGGTYPTFDYFARSLGLQVRSVPYRGEGATLELDLDALLDEARRSRPKVVYLANPDNPTGSYQALERLRGFAQALPEQTLLMLDEAYVEFADHDGALGPLPGSVRLRSFSKAYGLAGLRIGYAVAPPELLAYAQQARIHYAVSGIAQAMAEEVLEQPAHTRTLLEQTRALRQRFCAMAEAHGVAYIPSSTNFVALPYDDPLALAGVHQTLLERGVSTSRPAPLDGRHLLRVTLQPDVFTPDITSLLFTRPRT